METNLRKLLTLAVLALVAGCVETRDVAVSPAQASSSALATAKAFMADRLKDPESMKIRDVAHYKTVEGDRIVCGEMDAKNSYGGYGGYSTFYVRLQGNVVKKAFFGRDYDYDATDGCLQAARGSIKVAV